MPLYTASTLSIFHQPLNGPDDAGEKEDREEGAKRRSEEHELEKSRKDYSTNDQNYKLAILFERDWSVGTYWIAMVSS